MNTERTRRLVAVFAVALVAITACGPREFGTEAAREDAVSSIFNGLSGDNARLARFIHDMPKGGDIHSHESGAVDTESLISWGASSGQCVMADTYASKNPPCGPSDIPISQALDDRQFYSSILCAWSMECETSALLQSRHDFFYGIFQKISSVAGFNETRVLARLRTAAFRENVSYLELYNSLGSSAAGPVGAKYLPAGDAWSEQYLEGKIGLVAADPDFKAALQYGLDYFTGLYDGAEGVLGCGTSAAADGCKTAVRYVSTADRGRTRDFVFAQFVFGFELARRDPRIVGVNLLNREEGGNSLQYFNDEMLAAGVIRKHYAALGGGIPANLSLHSGELVPDILTPEQQPDLRFHIRRSVEVAGAQRIGHGSDLAYEYEGPGLTPETLLAGMRARNTAVEILLTSNEQLLGLSGPDHPFRTYLSAGVPTVIATDDAGMLRTAMTGEFVKAVKDHGLDYGELKQLARNSIEYAFVEGASLWTKGNTATPADPCAGSLPWQRSVPEERCASFLDSNPKAGIEWRLEDAFLKFENRVLNGEY